MGIAEVLFVLNQAINDAGRLLGNVPLFPKAHS